MFVYNGIIASGETISNGERQIVWEGGKTQRSIILSGGLQDVESGGCATSSILRGGTQEVWSSSHAKNTTILSGGVQRLFLGGSANSTVISKGGSQYLFQGNAQRTSVLTGGIQIASCAVVRNTTIRKGGILEVGWSTIASDISVNNGGKVIISGGIARNIKQNIGGSIQVKVGAYDADEIVAGTNAKGSFSIGKGVASNFIAYKNGRLEVAPDAVAVGTTVASGGTLYISRGGEARSTTVEHGGELIAEGEYVHLTSFSLKARASGATSNRPPLYTMQLLATPFPMENDPLIFVPLTISSAS